MIRATWIASAPTQRRPLHIQSISFRSWIMKKFSLKVWRLKNLDYFCVPLLKRREQNRKQSVVIRAIPWQSSRLEPRPPHIKNSNSSALKKLKLNFNKIWRWNNLHYLCVPFEKRRNDRSRKTTETGKRFWKQNLTANMTNRRFRKKPDRHQSSLKYR